MSFPFPTIDIDSSYGIFELLDQDSLLNASLTCRSWRDSINKDRFFRRYALSRTEEQLRNLTIPFFTKILSHFRPQQVYFIDAIKISRYFLNSIPESPENITNLKIAKLIASLGGYREHLQNHIEDCIKQWHPNSPETEKEFRGSSDYFHLYLLGSSLAFIHNRSDESETIAKFKILYEKEIHLLKRSELNKQKWFQSGSSIESLISVDYCLLKAHEPSIIDPLFESVFKRHTIKHLFCPRSMEYLALPRVFFKALFSSLQAEHLETFNPISVADDEQLAILGKWLKESHIKLDRLSIYLSYGAQSISQNGLLEFRDTLKSTSVQVINLSGCEEAEDSIFTEALAKWKICLNIMAEHNIK